MEKSGETLPANILIRYLSGQGDETEKLLEKFECVLEKMKEGYRLSAEKCDILS